MGSWVCTGAVLMVYWDTNAIAILEEGMREEKFEVANANNLTKNFVKRGDKERGQ